MKITCGPADDQRVVEIDLPIYPKKIGVFISGGLDSAILYFLLMLANSELNHIHSIVPYTIPRTEGSKFFARPVIAHVHSEFKTPYREPVVVGDPSLPGHLQVASGGYSALYGGCDYLYGGVIAQLPEHKLGELPPPPVNYDVVKMPFEHLTKYHIIDLIVKLDQQALFYLTHSCSTEEIGRCNNNCNGCNERAWGFSRLGLTDPSII
jgi:hypothetical protein